jgi:hypothetical protein
LTRVARRDALRQMTRSRPYRLVYLIMLVALLSACASSVLQSDVADAEIGLDSPIVETAAASLSLRGSASFSRSQLTSTQRTWYDRVWTAINATRPAVDKWARSGDLYAYGRSLNLHMQNLLMAFRVTGDLRLLDEIDRIGRIMESKLADAWSNGTKDGFRNWRWLNSSGTFYGKDTHVMDEMMTHAGVAAMAYALHVNRGLRSPGGVDYGARAMFWSDYLKRDFEAKWRKRNNKASGFPFLNITLMHPHAQWMRYHYYMGALTGDAGYRREAERLAKTVDSLMVRTSTSHGSGLVWCHGTTRCLYAQPVNYARYTVGAIIDLAWEGVAPFDGAYLGRLATTMTALVATNGTRNIAADVAGGVRWNGLNPHSTTAQSIRRLTPMSALLLYDRSGRLERIVHDVYGVIEWSPDTPRSVEIPIAMLLRSML